MHDITHWPDCGSCSLFVAVVLVNYNAVSLCRPQGDVRKMASNTEYADLEIRILERQDQGYPVELTVDGEREFPRGFLSPAIAAWQPSADAAADGDHLFQSLFADAALAAAWAEVRGLHPDRRVRLRLDATVPELHALPWELLREPRPDAVPVDLAASAATPFSRYFAGAWQPGSPILRRPIRMLAVIAVPDDLDSLGLSPFDAEQELTVLRQALSSLDMELDVLPAPCTLSAVEAALAKGYHILHFVGHGGFDPESRQAAIVLADPQNRAQVVTDRDFAAMLDRLQSGEAQERRLRMIYLDGCETAARDAADAFRGFAPALVQIGVPGVLAMQERIAVATSQRFAQVFYGQLLEHGQIDVACNRARAAVLTAQLPGASAPVLFMRLRNGRLWYEAGFAGDDDGQWQALLSALRSGRCTPILGPELANFVMGSRREIAERWAQRYGFPLAPHDAENLASVSQFLAVKFGSVFPRDELTAHVRQELCRRFGAKLAEDCSQLALDELFSAVAGLHHDTGSANPYRILAELPVKLFLTANYSNLLADALHAAAKEPRVEYCRWNEFLQTEPSIYDQEPGFRPAVAQPLVYHLFGNLRQPDSIVLTEDDYLDYLIGITRDQELIPGAVQSALANSALLFLGFKLEEWEFRVLFRSIIHKPGSGLLSRYKHIAVQINPEDSRIEDVERARQYLESYFQKADISIYWGSAEEFIAELGQRWQEGRP